jgi:diaminopimelate decarboxylase
MPVPQLFSGLGLNIDASSGYEVDRALRAGVAPGHISLSSQELPADFDKWVEKGVEVNACSITQLERFGKRFPGGKVRRDLRMCRRHGVMVCVMRGSLCGVVKWDRWGGGR